MRLRTVRFVSALVALGTACGGNQGGHFVEVAPASHNGGDPVAPWTEPSERNKQQGPPHPGRWTPTRTFQAPRFTIEYPSTARAYLTTDERFAQPELWIQDLPDCTAACDIFISIFRVRDHVSLDSIVRIMTAPDPQAGGQPKAHVIDTTTVGGRRAIRVAIDCRGCTETSFVTERHGWIAQIAMGICACDSALAPRFEDVVRSFRWSDPPAAPAPGR